jgi:Ca2+-binding RTX toxin-like protein
MSMPKVAAVITSVVVATATGLVSLGATAEAGITGSAQAQQVQVTLADCTVVGTDYGEYLSGTDGDDVICGLGGNDSLISSPGDDTYVGGDGVDGILFAYTNVPTGVKADLLTGIATGHGTDTIDGVENLFGTPFRDTLRGDDESYVDENGTVWGNLLVGYDKGDLVAGRGGGYDRLDGGRGNDTLMPGPGDDQAYGGTGIDTLSFRFSTVGVTVDITLGTASGQGTDYALAEHVVGSPYDDTITGGTEGYGANTHHANTLWGLAGDDTLFGGPLGNDKLFGQAGDDTLDGGTATDRCDGGTGTDTAVNCETLVSVP